MKYTFYTRTHEENKVRARHIEVHDLQQGLWRASTRIMVHMTSKTPRRLQGYKDRLALYPSEESKV